MAKTPKLDPSRLDRLRADWLAAAAANARAQDQILQAAKDKNQFEFDIRGLQDDASQLRSQLDAREVVAKVAEMRSAQDKAAAHVDELRLAAAPIAEKASALGALYRNCAEFLGVDPNA